MSFNLLLEILNYERLKSSYTEIEQLKIEAKFKAAHKALQKKNLSARFINFIDNINNE